MQGGLTVMGLLSLAATLLAGWAERRRNKRANLDDVGFMPWPMISIVGTLATLLFFAVAIKLG